MANIAAHGDFIFDNLQGMQNFTAMYKNIVTMMEFLFYTCFIKRADISVFIITEYKLATRGTKVRFSERANIYILSTSPRPGLRSTQPHINLDSAGKAAGV
jgi:hypothetical protein